MTDKRVPTPLAHSAWCKWLLSLPRGDVPCNCGAAPAVPDEPSEFGPVTNEELDAAFVAGPFRAPAVPDKREEYARRNPLGGPARTFEAMAERLRAGDSLDLVLADFGYATSAERDALRAALRDVIRESDRDTNAYIRARALLAATEDGA